MSLPEQLPKAPDDVSDVPWPVNLGATPDFRWSYFSGSVFNVLGLAAAMEREEAAWYALRQRAADEADIIKLHRQDLATLEAQIRDNLSFDTIKEHAGSTKDERAAYVDSVVKGAPEYQEIERQLAQAQRKQADLDMAAEKSAKTWTRLDRVIRFYERVLATLSTFAPQSEHGALALREVVPVWDPETHALYMEAITARQALADARAGGDPELIRQAEEGAAQAEGALAQANGRPPSPARQVGGPPILQEPPPGFDEAESDMPF